MFRSLTLSMMLFFSMLLLVIPIDGFAIADFMDESTAGPFIDKVAYKIITSDDEQVLALLNNDVDLIGDKIHPRYLSQLEASDNIEVAKNLNNGYGMFILNCDKYPYNISGFRRAIAIGLNKTWIVEELWDGEAVPHDCVLPRDNPFSIEGNSSISYYDSNIKEANTTLDGLGFFDIDDDGFREAPNGSQLIVEIESVGSGLDALTTASHLADTLDAMGIQYDGFHDNFGWTGAYDRMYQHGDFDLVFMRKTFDDFDASWLGYEFWSNYSDRPFTNLANFRNQTFDSHREELLYSAIYSEVEYAAAQMQEILLYECPVIPCYQAYFASAYRTDKFEGIVNDVIKGSACWWTNQKVRLRPDDGGPWGGTFRWSLPLDLDTFNFMASTSIHTMKVLQMLYDSLLRRDPDGNPINWLADQYTVETHEDNPDVTQGHTRLTFSIIHYGLWTDLTPITTEDIAFTLNYYREADGNPYGVDLEDMILATAPNPDSVIVEFDTESIWHLDKLAFKPIIPRHFFIALNPNNWKIWDPSPPQDEMITSGPYNVSDYMPGEFCELVFNPDYLHQYPPCGNVVKFQSSPDIPSPPPQNITYTQGTRGNEIEWYVVGHYPHSYSLYYEDQLIEEGFHPYHIILNVDNHSLGFHYYTLSVIDIYGYERNSTIQVEVITQSEALSRQLIFWSPAMIAGVGLVIIFITARREYARSK